MKGAQIMGHNLIKMRIDNRVFELRQGVHKGILNVLEPYQHTAEAILDEEKLPDDVKALKDKLKITKRSLERSLKEGDKLQVEVGKFKKIVAALNEKIAILKEE